MTTKSQVPVFRHIGISQKRMKIFSKPVGFKPIKQFKNELQHNEKAKWWFKKIYFWNIMYVQLYIWYCLFCSGSRAVLSAETMFEASKLGRSSSKASPMPSPLGPPSMGDSMTPIKPKCRFSETPPLPHLSPCSGFPTQHKLFYNKQKYENFIILFA